MKYLAMVAVGLVIAGCVEADSPVKFKTEDIGYPFYSLKRTVDEDYKVVCYTHTNMVSCVKL